MNYYETTIYIVLMAIPLFFCVIYFLLINRHKNKNAERGMKINERNFASLSEKQRNILIKKKGEIHPPKYFGQSIQAMGKQNWNKKQKQKR